MLPNTERAEQLNMQKNTYFKISKTISKINNTSYNYLIISFLNSKEIWEKNHEYLLFKSLWCEFFPTKPKEYLNTLKYAL